MSRSDNSREAANIWVVRHWSTLHPTRSGGGGYVRRPLNCFMLFRTWWVQNQMHLPEHNTPDMQGMTTSKRAARAWGRMPREQRDVWTLRADAWRDRHATIFPDYKFSPRRANAQRLTQSPPAEYLRTRRRSASVPPFPQSAPYQPELQETTESDPASLPGSPQEGHVFAPVPEGWSPSCFVPQADISQMTTPDWPPLEHAQSYIDFTTGEHYFEPVLLPVPGVFDDLWQTPYTFPPVNGDALSYQFPPSAGPSDSTYAASYAPFPGAPFVPAGNFMPPSYRLPATPAPLEPFPLVPSNAPVPQDQNEQT